MAGLTNTQIVFFRHLAKQQLPQDIRNFAVRVIEQDKTGKNAGVVKSLCNEFSRTQPEFIQLKARNNNILIEDVSDFSEARYFLSPREKFVYEHIRKINKVSHRLHALNIRYINATLLYGESGAGKKMFGRYLAYKMGIPYVYINLAMTVDSKLGQTSQNLMSVFRDLNGVPCVLMLDEVDAIAEKRSNQTDSAGKEVNRMVITLMQEFDRLPPDVVVLAATNRLDILDPAFTRRFSLTHEVVRLTKEEMLTLAERFLSDVGFNLGADAVEALVDKYEGKSQSYLVNALIEEIAERLVLEVDDEEEQGGGGVEKDGL